VQLFWSAVLRLRSKDVAFIFYFEIVGSQSSERTHSHIHAKVKCEQAQSRSLKFWAINCKVARQSESWQIAKDFFLFVRTCQTVCEGYGQNAKSVEATLWAGNSLSYFAGCWDFMLCPVFLLWSKSYSSVNQCKLMQTNPIQSAG